ncbi:MAG TPA: PIG-L family deacetylase [Thermoanaerobaculia bacterium]|nr:PIG-L family deacetylase [Thermoanaerobaculia bacterium]
MLSRAWRLCLLLCLASPAGGWSSAAGLSAVPLDLKATDRILVLAPHPDDEVLGCGGVLQRAVARGLPVEVAFLTYGDANTWSFLAYRLHPVLRPAAAKAMGEIRRKEALAADAILGLPADRLTFLGYPDAGTLDLWSFRWGESPPGHGPLTRARAVPYSTAFRPGAAYKGEEVLADLESLFSRFRPTQVFVSHPADKHPDHQALYLFTQVALWNLAGSVSPAVHPYLVHYADWPVRGSHALLPEIPPGSLGPSLPWQSLELSAAEVEGKRRALAAHRSQWRSGERHLLPFVRATEITGDFPLLSLPRDGAEEPGIERLPLRRVGERLEVTFLLGRQLPPATHLALWVFSYRRGQPFARAPKLEIRIGSRSVEVRDQGRRVAAPEGIAERSPGRVTLSLPLGFLGNPERLLLSARGLDDRGLAVHLPWRIVELVPFAAPTGSGPEGESARSPSR